MPPWPTHRSKRLSSHGRRARVLAAMKKRARPRDRRRETPHGRDRDTSHLTDQETT